MPARRIPACRTNAASRSAVNINVSLTFPQEGDTLHSSVGILCYDKSSYCSIYQLRNEYCDNRYTILVDNNFLPVPQACQRSCGQCIPVQRLQDISTLFDHAAVTHEPMPSTTGKPAAQPDKCIDRRDDCVMQKAYGFCAILNEKYPDDCVKTCHPDCTSTL